MFSNDFINLHFTMKIMTMKIKMNMKIYQEILENFECVEKLQIVLTTAIRPEEPEIVKEWVRNWLDKLI